MGARVETDDVPEPITKDGDTWRRNAHCAVLVRISPSRRRVALAVAQRMICDVVRAANAGLVDATVRVQREVDTWLMRTLRSLAVRSCACSQDSAGGGEDSGSDQAVVRHGLTPVLLDVVTRRKVAASCG